MAGSDSQKNLLTLIRNFSSERSEGERRVVNQKKRILDLSSELDAANAELEQAKREKETIEQEVKGLEVELSINEASVQALQARIALTNNEISILGSDLVALKSEESSLRDRFIEKMLELNAKIRKFQDCFASSFIEDNHNQAILNGDSLVAHKKYDEQTRLKKELAQITLHIEQEEQQYKAEAEIHDQIQKDLSIVERKTELLGSLMRESMELQELKRLTSELEEVRAALGEELQKRFLCPRCNKDNSGELSEILQASDGTSCN